MDKNIKEYVSRKVIEYLIERDKEINNLRKKVVRLEKAVECAKGDNYWLLNECCAC